MPTTATVRARQLTEAGQVEEELGALLDRLACLAATFLEYGQKGWFERIIGVFREIYSMPLAEGDAQRFGYSSRISRDELAPGVWSQLMPQVYALGGLAVRRGDWAPVRALTLQLAERLTGYETNWLRHSVTMMSRASRLHEEQEGRVVELSILNVARADAGRLECLRPTASAQRMRRS